VKLLLDTHALLWSFSDEENLSQKARRAVKDYANDTYVSAASAWEIATKFRIGKLPQAAPFVYTLEGSLRKMGFKELAITVGHAQRAGLLAGEHKDPFDRILIAQAQAENLLLVSNEKLFDGFGVQRLW
jgi:PIN domain nuclease of toxin-antitoxin system